MILAISVLILFLWLFIMQEILRRFPRFALVIFIILPIFTAYNWLEKDCAIDWFNWLKMISMTLALIGFSIFRLTHIGENKFAKMSLCLIFVINIFEAVAKDVLSFDIEHYLNATAGILLILTMNKKIDSIQIIKEKYCDINWNGATFAWIICYTLWNWTFIYLNYTNEAAIHMAVLGAPLVIAFINKGRWLQTRALTLSTFIFTYFLLYNKLYPYTQGIFWKNEYFSYFIASLSLFCITLYAIKLSWNFYFQRKVITIRNGV